MPESIKRISTEHEAEKPGQSEGPQTDVQQLEGSLDTIKEILVGQYTREVHKRIDTLEDRMAREAKSTQEAGTRKLDLLESFMKREIEILRADLNQTSERFRELRDQLSSHYKSLSEEIARSQHAIHKELENAIDGLDARKTDRQFISALLIRMATALQKDSRGVPDSAGLGALILDSKGVKRSA